MSHPRKNSFPVRESSLADSGPQDATPKPAYALHASAAASSSSLHSTARGASTVRAVPAGDAPARHQATSQHAGVVNFSRTQPRQHIQGFFEPSLPTASHTGNNGSGLGFTGLSASQIAAQAATAMHVQQPRSDSRQHDRRRSQANIEPQNMQTRPAVGPRKSSFPLANSPASSSSQSRSTSQAPKPISTNTAANAASAVYPRSPLGSPSFDYVPPTYQRQVESPVEERDPKHNKEKTRRKLFSKPNKMIISKDKDGDKREVKTAGLYSNFPAFNQSSTSLAESIGGSSLYSNATGNASTSTLVPADRSFTSEREKPKHNFLSRQKNKLNDQHHNLQLSSASSNSRPTDPAAPQSIYSFQPSSPGLGGKSISGFDLRHGGRALREKKKEEKAAAASSFIPSKPAASTPNLDSEAFRDPEGSVTFGPPSATSTELGYLYHGLTNFGLQNMSGDDAWPLLKARLLTVFSGEELRTPVEDFNRLLLVHIQRCISLRTPSIIVDDLRDLLNTGFRSLEHTLRNVPDERIVLHLVEAWSFVFGTVLPFLQAVFHPLDLEFRGRGALVHEKMEVEFWIPSAYGTRSRQDTNASLSGAAATGSDSPSTASATLKPSPGPNQTVDVRTLILLSYRDNIIMPRHEKLLAIFSRLSLDSINVLPMDPSQHPYDLPLPPRPGTAASVSSMPGSFDPSSVNSQGSTYLDSSAAGSLGARSRATSNTSAGSFHSSGSGNPRRPGTASGSGTSATGSTPTLQSSMSMPIVDSGKVTETAARMLQCISVLSRLRGYGASLEAEESESLARRRMDRLSRELKLNWLGRGRTGRNRKGFVGARVRPVVGVGA